MAETLASIEGRPWAEWGKAKKPITKHQLAGLLKPFGISSDSVRIGTHTPKGYHRHQFAEAFARYLEGTPLYETQHRNNATAAGTSPAFQNATPSSAVAFQKCEKPLRDVACCGVAAENGGDSHNFRCAQCGGEPDGDEKQFQINGMTVWLHSECRQFFQPGG
jgi:hypothetical protein